MGNGLLGLLALHEVREAIVIGLVIPSFSLVLDLPDGVLVLDKVRDDVAIVIDWETSGDDLILDFVDNKALKRTSFNSGCLSLASFT